MAKLGAAVGEQEPDAPRVDWGAAGAALMDAALDELLRVGRETLPDGIEIHVTRPSPLEGARPERGGRITGHATVTLNAGPQVHVSRLLGVYRSDANAVFDLSLLSQDSRPLPARLADATPEVSPALRLRIAGWAQGVLAGLAESLAQALE